jgi:hypothetical protein
MVSIEQVNPCYNEQNNRIFIDESGFTLGIKALANLAVDYMDQAKK